MWGNFCRYACVVLVKVYAPPGGTDRATLFRLPRTSACDHLLDKKKLEDQIISFTQREEPCKILLRKSLAPFELSEDADHRLGYSSVVMLIFCCKGALVAYNTLFACLHPLLINLP